MQIGDMKQYLQGKLHLRDDFFDHLELLIVYDDKVSDLLFDDDHEQQANVLIKTMMMYIYGCRK